MSTLNITASALSAAGYRPLYAGDTYDYTFNVTDCNGTAINLTGAKIWFTIKADPTLPDNQAQLAYISTDVTRIEITDAPNGVMVVHFLSADTACLAGTWEYDIRVLSQSGAVFHAARGTIEFLTSVTKSYQ